MTTNKSMPHIFVLSVFSPCIYKDVLLAISQKNITIEEITYIGYDDGLQLTLSCSNKSNQLHFAAELIRIGYNVKVKGYNIEAERDRYSYGQTYKAHYQGGTI